MNEHREIRDLLGPFVMGELDAGEARAVEAHLEGCAGCREEAGYLRLAHDGLLDLAAVSEAPPAALRDRVVGAHRTPATLPPTPIRRRGIPRLAVAAAVLLMVLGAAYAPSLLGDREVAAATLEPTAGAPEAGGEVEIRGAGENMEVRLEAWNLPPCESEEYYELWFVEDEERVSAGTFSIGQSGDAEVSLNAPRFATSYPEIGVTVERDRDPRPSGQQMLGGDLRDL